MECAYHPDREAISECSKCGKPLCNDCSRSSGLCIDCAIPSEVEKETVKASLMSWNTWINSFMAPSKAFKAGIKQASFAGTAMNVLVGLVNAGMLAFLLVIAGKMPPGVGTGSLIDAFGYTSLFLILLAVWLALTLGSYSFAMLVGGMGSLKQHIYVLSLPIPLLPIAILVMWLILWLMFLINPALLILGAVLITVYVMDILIAAMREAHRFGFMQAAVSGVIPAVVVGAAVGLLIFIFRK